MLRIDAGPERAIMVTGSITGAATLLQLGQRF
jgi:hypothetical protein